MYCANTQVQNSAKPALLALGNYSLRTGVTCPLDGKLPGYWLAERVHYRPLWDVMPTVSFGSEPVMRHRSTQKSVWSGTPAVQ